MSDLATFIPYTSAAKTEDSPEFLPMTSVNDLQYKVSNMDSPIYAGLVLKPSFLAARDLAAAHYK
jgi:hypothetical protein